LTSMIVYFSGRIVAVVGTPIPFTRPFSPPAANPHSLKGLH
jgi:hypothetical protein